MTTKAHTTTKHAPKHVKPPPTVDYAAVIKEMRADMFMLAYRMQATVHDALVAEKAGLRELTQGHLQEMERILQSTMERYR